MMKNETAAYSYMSIKQKNVLLNIGLIPGVLLLMLLTGCGAAQQRVETSITRTNAFGENYREGGVFILVQPYQNGSAEFTNYARHVEKRLVEQGFTIVPPSPEARYAVLIDFGVGTGVQNFGTLEKYNYTTERYETKLTSSMVYGKYFKLKIFDLKLSTDKNFVGVYEGTVETSDAVGTFFTVSHCLIDALFRDFLKNGTDNKDHSLGDKFKKQLFGRDTSCIQ